MIKNVWDFDFVIFLNEGKINTKKNKHLWDIKNDKNKTLPLFLFDFGVYKCI